jgi:UDP-glucuronate decarboxylase
MKPFLDDDIAEIVAALADTAHAFAGKTMLIGGGWGFLGKYFAATFEYLNREVLDEPCKLIICDVSLPPEGSADRTWAGQHCRFLHHDVTEPLEIDEPLHFVVNAAAIASPFHYQARPLETLDASVTGTRNFLELAKAHNARLLFFSSSEIYGDPDAKHVPTPESYRGNVSCIGPRACYDESKRLGETLCYIYHEMHGVATCTVRPFNVFGPGLIEMDYRVLANFASCIKGGRPLKVYGSGTQTRTFCYATDAVNGFLRVAALGTPGQPYNIGTPDPEITMSELAERLEHVLGRRLDKELVEPPDSYPLDEPMRRCPDIRKARLQLGYEPRIDLDDGLARFLAWSDTCYTGIQ